jgi:hypothetical protein
MTEAEAKQWGEGEMARWQERQALQAEHEQQRAAERQVYEQQLAAAQYEAASQQERDIQYFCQYTPDMYLKAAEDFTRQAEEARADWDEERAVELEQTAQTAYNIGEIVAQRYQQAENQRYFLASAQRLAVEHPELQDPNNWKCQKMGQILDEFPELQSRADGCEIAWRALTIFDKKARRKDE